MRETSRSEEIFPAMESSSAENQARFADLARAENAYEAIDRAVSIVRGDRHRNVALAFAVRERSSDGLQSGRFLKASRACHTPRRCSTMAGPNRKRRRRC